MKLTKKVLYTLMAFACLNVFMLTSCNDEKAADAPAETTEPAADATSTPAPKDSVVAPAGKMDTAAVKPVEAPVKK